MKKTAVVIIGCFGMLLAGRLLAAEKTGYVDMQKVFKNYEKAQESEQTFKKEVDGQQEKINKLQEEVKNMQAELEKKKAVLKEDEKKKKEDELKEKMQEFSKLWQETNQQLDKRREELEKKCLQEILEAVKDYGKKQKYGMIFDSRVVLYGPEGTDITEEIIKALNK